MTFYQDVLQHIDRLMEQRPVSKASLGPFRELVLVMAQASPESKPPVLEERLRGIKEKEGFPLFSREDLPLDFDTASALFEKFTEHLGRTDRDDKAGLKKALHRSKGEAAWTKELFKAILSQNRKALSRFAKDVDLSPEVLQFLGQTALKPSLQALREALSGGVKKEEWDKGYCPACGSQPSMAYFDKSGKRFLHCELCGKEWDYPRLRCPFCENVDHETLSYFQAEKEEGIRVDYCEKCLRYLKTIDRRAFEEAVPMEVENLATLYLDVLATEQGLK